MFCLLQSSTKHCKPLVLVVRIMYDLFYSQSECMVQNSSHLEWSKTARVCSQASHKTSGYNFEFLLKRNPYMYKTIQYKHHAYNVSIFKIKSKRLLSYDQFFYKILIGKLHCFLPIRLLRDVTTNFLYHISSNNYRTYKKNILMQFTSLMPIAEFFFHVVLGETLHICHANIFRKIN